MGIYDREYYREEPRGFTLGGPRMMVTNLVLINVAVYVFHSIILPNFLHISPDAFTKWFGLYPDIISRPWHLYQLLTYGFLHDPTNYWHILINMAILWFLGAKVEGIYGQRQFLQFYLSTIVLSGLFWLLVDNVVHPGGNIPLVGASGGVMGVFLVFVMHFPRRLIYVYFLIPVPIWLLAAFMLAGDMIGAMRNPGGGVANSAHLAGAAFGYLFYRTQWQLGRYLPKRFSLRGFSLRQGPRIHRPEEEDVDDAALKAEVDRILEKISRSGEASLSSRERQTLEDASRRYQQRGRR